MQDYHFNVEEEQKILSLFDALTIYVSFWDLYMLELEIKIIVDQFIQTKTVWDLIRICF